MKKLFAIVIVVGMVLSLCACGVNTNFTKTESVTENGVTTTTTTTTTNGQTTTETHTETAGDVTTSKDTMTVAEAAEDGEIHQVPIVVYNESDKTGIVLLGCCPAGAGTRDNLLPEGTVIGAGENIDMHINFDKDNLLWDFYIGPEGAADDIYVFYEIDISNAPLDEGFSLHFIEKDDGGWRVEG